MENNLSQRIDSIDIFRAATMLLMIFVNDLWTLSEVPQWLLHKKSDVDGLGFADAIFPAFLFIVGLSIPLAINQREKKKCDSVSVIMHISMRTVALVIMGLFMVNYKSLNPELIPISKNLWKILMACGIFLVWMHYPSLSRVKKKQVLMLQISGIVLLASLAIIFRGGTTAEPEWMKVHWWGILGAIGWAYLVASLLYMLIRDRIIIMVTVVLLFHLLNIQEFQFIEEIPVLKFITSSSRYALVMSGVLATTIFLKLRQKGQEKKFVFCLLTLGALFLIYGFLMRPYWGGISKIRVTPSFTGICVGISFLSFAIFHVLVDRCRVNKWASFIAPAGTSTLTCYLVPYLIYPVLVMLQVKLPDFLTTGVVGLVKSMAFAFFIIYLTGLLGKVNIKLKV